MFQLYKSACWKAAVLAGCVISVLASCKKHEREEIFPTSLTMVNALNDRTSFLTAYFGESQPKIYARLVYIGNGAAYNYATNKTDLPVRMFRNHDTLHVDKPFLQTRLPLEPGTIYTHFVYGAPDRVQQKTVKEQLPSRSLEDSVVNLRFINLFENRAIDVVQLEPEAKTMASNLVYEQLTGFMKVPVTGAVENFRFEVRDHATGATLATFSEANTFPGSTLPSVAWLFKSRTMIVTGTWTDAGNFSARATTIGHY
ncbi:hypothetical protein WJU16_22625 [Chitinophaga pollutisoli]|uniref:DUF4397 domain-containing protein n=1 Tax=Chitinophaga pollutisoli TaxID=3133966 RepID=A0ABZ2YM11_9BACT